MEICTLSVQMNCLTRGTFHFQNRNSPHQGESPGSMDLNNKFIFGMNTTGFGIWVHSPQLVINEMKLQAGRLMAATRNGECGKGTQKIAERLQLGPADSSTFSLSTTSLYKIITARGNMDTT